MDFTGRNKFGTVGMLVIWFDGVVAAFSNPPETAGVESSNELTQQGGLPLDGAQKLNVGG